jgi:hypothetical protein
MSLRLLPEVALVTALSGLGCTPPGNPPPQPTDGGGPAFCGGIAAIRCAGDQSCVDDPRDDCDPAHGGADCGGVCVSQGQSACDAFPRRYVSRDPEQCARIRFACDPATESGFHDACGCGCQPQE